MIGASLPTNAPVRNISVDTDNEPQIANKSRTVAAIDLGSNSFHLIVARLVGGEFRVIDRIKDRVRVGAGLDADGNLTLDARKRALHSLRRFAERVHGLPAGNVRAVGTFTFRQARNAREFLEEGEAILGHPLEVISGEEEARLVYQGVLYSSPPWFGRRLVIDIGGGSTEFVLGEGTDVLEAESTEMGCVSFSEKFFPDGVLSAKNFRRAVTAARVSMAGVEQSLKPLDWKVSIGTSGTMHAIATVLKSMGENTVTPRGLQKLRKRVIAAKAVQDLALPKLGEKRKQVLAGGLAILVAAFQSLKLATLDTCPGSLKEGVLWNLLGRLGDEDVRDSTIRRFARHFQLDQEQGFHVERTVLELLQSTAEPWNLIGRPFRQMLSWSARLYEIGLSVSHSGYHKHGEYLIRNSDMPGFSTDDQLALAALVRGHRRKIPTKLLRQIPHFTFNQALRMCLLLRLAVVVNRRRRGSHAPLVTLRVTDQILEVEISKEWLKRHALTRAELVEEARYLEEFGYRLSLVHREVDAPVLG
jgi:exopolyphosphatase/guanosine-5'-triphosphate,3'-diphosphate pyrophosphatase